MDLPLRTTESEQLSKHSLASDGLPSGWFFPPDAELYLECVRRLRHGSRMVEIGTWLGRSLATVLPTAIERGIGVWSVDTWEGSPGDVTQQLVLGGLNAFDTFRANMEFLGLWGSFTVVHSDSAFAALRFPEQTLDLVFLDADHRYEAVKRDITVWWPKLRVGGMFLGHDYGPHELGVVSAVDEVLGRPNVVSGITWMVRKKAHEFPP